MRKERKQEFELLLQDVFRKVGNTGNISVTNKKITKKIFEFIKGDDELRTRYQALLWKIGRDSVNPLIGRRIKQNYHLKNIGRTRAVVKIDNIIPNPFEDVEMISSITEHKK